MRYHLLALDLDGTLLDDDKTISACNQDAIRAAKDLGVMVTLSTGRMYRSAIRFANELKIELPLITYNGALIKDRAGSVHRELLLPLESAHTVLAVAREYDLHVNVFIADDLFVDRNDVWTKRYYQTSRIPPRIVSNLQPVLTAAPNAMALLGSKEKLRLVRTILAEKLIDKAHVTTSDPHFVEIIHPNASKQSGLAYLLRELGFKTERVIAIGDNYNDLDMINYAGLGVAMANAPEEVRAQADYVTGNNNNGGVAHVINKFILAHGKKLSQSQEW